MQSTRCMKTAAAVLLSAITVFSMVSATLGLFQTNIISATGEVLYPQPDPAQSEFGVWWVPSYGDPYIPPEATWVIAQTPDYPSTPGISTILNWADLRPGYDVPITTANELARIVSSYTTRERQLRNFWGIIFICEEQFKGYEDEGIIAFDSINSAPWFQETLLGLTAYRNSGHPSATRDEWKCEMYLRMVRGFYTYIKGLGVKAGITIGGYDNYVDETRPLEGGGARDYFGMPALTYIKANSDFVMCYHYTSGLDFGISWDKTREYMRNLDSSTWSHPLKIWILTRYFGDNYGGWEREAIALEMKNLLDRKWVITTYYGNVWDTTYYDYDQHLSDIRACWQLYSSTVPYYETRVYGTNRMTGAAGYTYGWVQ